MGVGYAVGFSLAGLKFGIALGLFFGVLNMVPFFRFSGRVGDCIHGFLLTA